MFRKAFGFKKNKKVSKIKTGATANNIRGQMGACCVNNSKQKVDNEPNNHNNTNNTNNNKQATKSSKIAKSSKIPKINKQPPNETHNKSNQSKPNVNKQLSKAQRESIWIDLEPDHQLGSWLTNVPIFRRVPEDKRSLLGGMMTTEVFKSGENVFKQGDDGDRFYIIKEGKASVIVKMPDCQEMKVVARLSKGDYFGETALLSRQTRNATIQASSSTLIALSMDSNTFQKIVKSLNVQFAKRKGITERTNQQASKKKLKNETRDTIKTSKESQFIVNQLKNSVLFTKLDKQQIEQIAGAMWKKQYESKSTIVEQGKIDSNLYILQKGECSKYEIDDETNKKVHVKTYNTNLVIGEVGLMHNSPNQATFKTTKESIFWIIDRLTFRKILQTTSKEKLIEYENFLKSVPIFETLLEFERRATAEALDEVHFKQGDVVIKQGDVGDTFYIVRHGHAVVHKVEDGATEAIEVARLGPGNYFGERALIKGDVRAASVTVCDGDMDCLKLDREGFTLLLGPLGDIMNRKIEQEYDVRSPNSKKSDKNKTSSENKQKNDDPRLDMENRKVNARLRDFKIIGTLGKGSFGHVELVTLTTEPNRYFALKTVHKSHVVQLGQQEHIINEKNVLSSLNSLFIVRLFATYKNRNSVFFLLECVLGGELFALLRDRQAFDEPTSQFYAACVIEAFDHMHNKNIIYRDLKPENLLLDSTGYLKVTDFGFAKVVTDRTYTLCGTPDYLAPEVVSGIGHNKAVDWWTLGILIYEMICSFPPFYDEDPMQTYAKIMHGNIQWPRHFSKNATDLIAKLLHPKPTKRLGVIKGGAESIRKHAWYSRFDWKRMARQQLKAPYVPKIAGPTDLSNFEEYSDSDGNPQPYVDDGSNWDAHF